MDNDVLTRMQHQCVELTAHGWTRDRVATKLYIAPSTVTTHLRNARIALGASTIPHTILLAERKGLLR